MKMTYPRIFLTLACLVFVAPQVLAVTTAPAKSGKASAKHAKAAKAPTITPAATDEDDLEPDTKNALSTEYNCELGNKLTVYQNADDDKHIALAWKKRIHRLQRIETTTGANRFENRKYGLLWIGIPAKSILLDTKKGQQLANECKNAAQMTAELAAH
ncbi:hypothetical protein [Herminiimonas sp. CN]|uniref:hypothetical protein n=1 Tax=Herminiimonas sp. CN TaxID=1349818 RepID=UPI000ACCD6DD|nr:hypothetical protein [Herminiimonas sp. CN]